MLSSPCKKLLSKILFLQDFPTLIGSAFAFVAKLNGIFSQIDFKYFLVCKKGEQASELAWHKQKTRVLWEGGGMFERPTLKQAIKSQTNTVLMRGRRIGWGDNQSKLVQITTLHLSLLHYQNLSKK